MISVNGMFVLIVRLLNTYRNTNDQKMTLLHALILVILNTAVSHHRKYKMLMHI